MVSVIIPVYKAEKYLCECIDSVINQTYDNLEIILVDDGSPDNCGAICDEYACRDDRIKVIHKDNGGASDARNAGLSIAHGKYVYFLDSDDYIKPDAIEKAETCIEKKKADIVFFDSETLYEDFPDPDYHENYARKHTYRTEKGSLVLKKQKKNKEYYASVPLLLFRKSFIDKNDLSFIKGMIHEDELFIVLAFIRAERVAQLKDSIYVRRLRAFSVMSERVSVKGIHGLCACIIGYAKEDMNYDLWSIETGVLLRCSMGIAKEVLKRYLKLDRKSKKVSRIYIKQVIREMTRLIVCRVGRKYKNSIEKY